MTMITNDNPNPVRHILALESELVRVSDELATLRAEVERLREKNELQKNITFKQAKQLVELRAELAEAREYDNEQHAAIVSDTLEIGELKAERDALQDALKSANDLNEKLIIRDAQWSVKWENTIDTYSSLWHKAAVYQPRARALLKQVDKWRTRFDSLTVHFEQVERERDDYRAAMGNLATLELQNEAERDALRARLQAVEAAAVAWKHYLESNDMTYYVVNGVRHENEWYVQVRAALESETTK